MAIFYYKNLTPDELKRLQLSPHFTAYEFRCKLSGDVIIDEDVVHKIETLRHRVGNKRIYIVSGYRSNTPKSQHYKGKAVDFRTVDKSLRLKDVLPVALNLFNRVGIYCWGDKTSGQHSTIHGDIYNDEGRLFWWYTDSKGYNYMFRDEDLMQFINKSFWGDLPI